MLETITFTSSEKDSVMKTARFSGAVGQNAIVPKIVRLFAENLYDKILDFGCGKKQIHVKEMQYHGYDCHGYDFSLPDNDWALEVKWDIVYASNVLNVQTDLSMLRRTLQQIRDLLTRHGLFICNYPQPRHIPINVDDMEHELGLFFAQVVRYPEPGHHIWLCRKTDEPRVIH